MIKLKKFYLSLLLKKMPTLRQPSTCTLYDGYEQFKVVFWASLLYFQQEQRIYGGTISKYYI